ncbi:hypothetical protein [Thalassiella azotivora]
MAEKDVAEKDVAEKEPAGTDVSTATGPPTGGPGRPGEARTVRWVRTLLVVVGTGLPLALILSAALTAPRLNFYDYWYVLQRVTTASGGLDLRGVLTLQNEHPTFLPGVVYWLDATVLSGSNRGLGVLTVLMAAGFAVLVVRELPTWQPVWVRAATVVAVAFLAFSMKGVHNVVFGMSGVAWWSANLLATAALVLAARGRFVPGVVAAGAASACYGTAFPVWPALALVALLRRDGVLRVLTPLVLGALVLAGWFVLDGPATGPQAQVDPSVPDRVLTFFSTVGGLTASSSVETAALAGAVLAAVGAAACVRLLRPGPQGAGSQGPGSQGPRPGTPVPPRPAVFFPALLLLGAGAAAMIAASRPELGGAVGLASRYAPVSILVTTAVLGTAVSAWRVPATREPLVASGLVVGALVTTGLAAGAAGATRAIFPEQELLAVGLRVDAVDVVGARPVPPGTRELAQRLGVYPFTDDFDVACGGADLGDRVDLDALEPVPASAPGASLQGEVDGVVRGDGLRVEGWTVVGGEPADCVLVADAAGRVVGAGLVDLPRPDVTQAGLATHPALGWRAVAPDVGEPVVLVAGADGVLRRLDVPAGSSQDDPQDDPQDDEREDQG